MVRVETVDYWTRAIEDFDPTATNWTSTKTHGQGHSPFELWLWDTYRCRVSFKDAVTSAFFEFEDPKLASLFILKYSGYEHI